MFLILFFKKILDSLQNTSNQYTALNSELINPFHNTDRFLDPLKISETQRFFDVFKWFRERLMT